MPAEIAWIAGRGLSTRTYVMENDLRCSAREARWKTIKVLRMPDLQTTFLGARAAYTLLIPVPKGF